MNPRRAALSALILTAATTACALTLSACNNNAAPTSSHVVGKSKEDIGKYIVEIAGCHDCHTPGIMQGKELKDVPEDQWLTGSILGFNGPWGTSYASNLRQKLAVYPTEQAFIEAIRKRDPKNMRPPMPWASLHNMTDDDLGDVYAYVRSRGKAGDPISDPLPPGVAPTQPFVVMVPGISPAFPNGTPASAPAPK